MNKKLILIALTAMMFCSLSYAQKVIKNGSAVIIDCSYMDPKSYDGTKKPRTNTGSNDAYDISSKETNARVYKKFEVQGTDNITGINWQGAIDLCAKLNGSTSWRLPTQRELMLMWILNDKLVKNGISPFSRAYYWSATQDDNNTNKAWCTNLYIGFTYSESKTAVFMVRCVRDI